MFRCSKTQKSIYSKQDRIIVIGDLHGDYENTINLFKKIKLIDTDLNWIAYPKKTFVVQIGDQLDGGGRGHHETNGELKLIRFMEDINKKAQMVGGAVLSLIGNHEVMNLIGDYRFASKNDIASVGGIDIRKKIFSPGGELFNELSCTRNVVVKIGNWVFVHGGILPKHIDDDKLNDKFIIYVNNLMRLLLQGKKNPSDIEVQKYFLSSDGIIWDRDYGSINPNCSDWNTASKLLGVGNIVVGHTIQNTINSKCNNKIWRVDIGLSRVFGTKNMQVLEILDDGVPLPKNKFKAIRILN